MSIPFPKTRGKDAADFLAAHGLVAERPPVRSSDYALARACPFAYYLRCRLGIVPAWEGTGARLMGTMFHRGLESHLNGESPRTDISDLEQDTWTRITAANLSEQRAQWAVDDLRFANATATAWLEAAIDFAPFPPDLRCVGTEVLIEVPKTWWGHPVRGRFDGLLLDTATNELWILDAKTYGLGPAAQRASTCEFEFQTLLYLWMGLISIEQIRDKYKLPVDTTLAGFYHYILQTPQIKILKADREKQGLDFAREHYLRRLREYFAGTGEFVHHAQKRDENPLVHSSKVRLPTNPLEWFKANGEFNTLMTDAVDYCRRAPYPDRFPRNEWIRSLQCGTKDSSNTDKVLKSLSIYHPFFYEPVHRWPAIIERGGWVREFRDETEPPEIGD